MLSYGIYGDMLWKKYQKSIIINKKIYSNNWASNVFSG